MSTPVDRDAESTHAVQSTFLANMSHELRTPLGAIVGYADMLLDPRIDSDEQANIVRSIRRNGVHLLALINDILDLSKIESGKLILELLDVRYWRTVTEAISAAWVKSHERSIDLIVVPVGKLPRTIRTDPTRLRQILDNLLSNAVKFSPPLSKVEVHLAVHQQDSKNPRLMIEVIDHGIGMNSEVIGKLFQPFVQADPSTTRRYGGTGLGLSISKRLAKQLGGEISVSSQPGVGSRFSLSLPLTEAEASDLDDPDSFAVESKLAHSHGLTRQPAIHARVLLAEDNIDNQNIIRYFLVRAGMSVDIAQNGETAAELALTNTYDVVLMDMQMPVRDGYATTKYLRSRGYRLPIIALTANALKGDAERCKKAGCDVYLTKPIASDLLIETIASTLKRRSWVIKSADVHRRVPTTVPSNTNSSILSISKPTSVDHLRNQYRQSLKTHIERIRYLSLNLDFAAISSLAHQLRGSAGMYDYKDLSESAGLVEDAIREKQSTALIQELIKELCDQCEECADERDLTQLT